MSKLREMDIRSIRIKLVDGTKMNGQININREPGHDRLSDLIDANTNSFLVVFNATLYNDKVDKPVKHRTIFVNKDHVLWATPDDDQK